MNFSVMHLIDGAKLYGAEAVVLNLSIGLQRLGVRTVICCFADSKGREQEFGVLAESKGIKVRHIIEKRRLNLGTAKQIRDVCSRERISLINSHGYKASFYSMLVNLLYKIPFVVTCHSWTREGLKSNFYNELGKISMLFSKGVVAVSESVANNIGNWRLIEEKIVTIRNGIDIRNRASTENAGNTGKLRAELGLEVSTKLVGSIGRLIPLKAYDNFIEAAKIVCHQFEDVEFILAGEGPLLNSLRSLAKKCGVGDRFHFLGFRKDAINILRLLDVFVLPSRIEGLPISILEALAVGTPVVATTVGGVPSVIKHGVNGLLVKPDDLESLAENIVQLLRNENLARQVSNHGKLTVLREFSTSRMAREYLAFYRGIWG